MKKLNDTINMVFPGEMGGREGGGAVLVGGTRFLLYRKYWHYV